MPETEEEFAERKERIWQNILAKIDAPLPLIDVSPAINRLRLLKEYIDSCIDYDQPVGKQRPALVKFYVKFGNGPVHRITCFKDYHTLCELSAAI